MEPMSTPTPELFLAVATAVQLTGWTWDEVSDRGGPSSTTMTKLRQGSAEVVSDRTLRKLETAYGWPVGAARGLVADEEAVRTASLEMVNSATIAAAGGVGAVVQTSHIVLATDGGLTVDERNEIGEVARLLAEAAARLAAIAERSGGGASTPD